MIYEFCNILTNDECVYLIELSKHKLNDATTLGTKIENYRTAQNTWLMGSDVITDKVKLIISEKTKLPIDKQEHIHIVKYNIGGEYKQHHDFFHPNTNYYDSQLKRGGQRVYSCLIYLNDRYMGGETHFLKSNYKVIPQTGKLVIWDNLNLDGSLNYDSLHAGLPVISGEKWICIVWVREQKFN